MIKSLKTLLGLSLLGFFGVWTGCSSDSSPVAPYSASKAQDTTPASNPEVVFTDVGLTQAVRAVLLPADDITTTLYQADLLRLTVLKASDKGIKSLSGLEYATNLDTLVLDNNSITDVTPLARLTNLEYLNLNENSITDVAPLAGLTNLEYLNLRRNFIREVAPLASLVNLEFLNLDLNRKRFNDASSLASLTKLKTFAISDAPAIGSSTMGQLVASLPNLEKLKINYTGLTDISFLESKTKLKHLNISRNRGIRDFSPIACLPNLDTLHIRNMHAATFGNVADGYNVHIQYLIDKGVSVHRNQ